MSEPPTLLDMPDLALSVILEHCVHRSIQCLRKTCHDLRNRIDEIKPEPNITGMNITILPGIIWLDYNSNECSRRGKMCYNQYKPDKEGGYSIQTDRNANWKYVEGVDYISAFCRDLFHVVVHLRRTLRFFYMKFCRESMQPIKTANHQERFEKNVNNFLEQLNGILSNRKTPIRTNMFHIEIIGRNQLMKVLPYIQLVGSKSITITDPEDILKKFEMEELMKSEQWNQATRLSITGHFESLPPLQNFAHFQEFEIGIGRITAEVYNKLKDTFLHSTSWKKFSIHYKLKDYFFIRCPPMSRGKISCHFTDMMNDSRLNAIIE